MSARGAIRVIIADDDPIVREVLRRILAREAWIEVAGEVSDGLEAVSLTVQLQPEILLLDMLMPRLQGIGVLRELSSLQHQVRIIVVCSLITRQEIVQALQLGARGIIPKKSITSLPACIQAVMANRYFVDDKVVESAGEIIRDFMVPGVESNRFGLTRRELQVISLITQGGTNRNIAETLGVSEETVKRHVANIFDKVGMSNRLELAMFAVEHQLVSRQ